MPTPLIGERRGKEQTNVCWGSKIFPSVNTLFLQHLLPISGAVKQYRKFLQTTEKGYYIYLLKVIPNELLHLRKLSLERFLVNISVGFWSVGTKCNEISPSDIFSQIKWKQISICLVHLSWTGLEALKIAPWLSLQSGIVPIVIPSSFRNECIQTNCLDVSERDMYSASVDDRAIVFCTLLFQEIAAPLSNIKYLVLDCWDVLSDAQSASA